MASSKKKWILFALAVGTLVFAFLVLQRSGLLLNEVKKHLISEAEKATGRKIEIDSMEGGFFGKITLHGLRIGPPGSASLSTTAGSSESDILLKADKVEVSFSLWKLLTRPKEWADSLKGIDLFSPILEYQNGSPPKSSDERKASHSYFPPNINPFLKNLPPLPPVPISVEEGLVQILNPEGVTGSARVLLSHLHGEFVLQKSGLLSLSLKGASLGTEKENFWTAGHWQIPDLIGEQKTHLEALPLEQLNSYFGLRGASVQRGELSGDLLVSSANVSNRQWIQGLSVQGRLELKNGQGQWNQWGFQHAKAKLELVDRGLLLTEASVGLGASHWELQGDITDLTQPELHLRANCPRFPVSEVQKLFDHPFAVSPSGNLEIIANAHGPLEHLAGFVMMKCRNAHVDGFEFADLDCKANFSGRGVEVKSLETKVNGGRLNAEGFWHWVAKDGGKGELRANVTELALGPWLKERGFSKSAGNVQGFLHWSGSPETYRFDCDLVSDHACLEGQNLAETKVQFKGDQDRFFLKLKTGWRAWREALLELAAKHNSRHFAIQNAKLSNQGKPLATFSGVIPFHGSDPLYLKLNAAQLSARELSSLVPGEFKGLEGPVSLKASGSGSLAEPEIHFEISSAELRSVRKMPFSLLIKGSGNKKEISFDQFNLSEGAVLGRASFGWQRGGLKFLDLRFSNASLPLLSDLVPGLAEAEHGSLEGLAKYQNDGGAGEEKAELKLGTQKLSWASVNAEGGHLEADLRKKRWYLSKLEASQEEGGSFNMTGSLDLNPGGKVEASAKAEKWRWNDKAWSFQNQIMGACQQIAPLRFKGTFLADQVKLEKEHLDSLQFAWDFSQDGPLKIDQLAWGEGLKGRLEYGPKPKSFEMALSMTDYRPKSLLEAFGYGKSWEEALSGDVSGSYENGVKDLHVNLKLGRQGQVMVRLVNPNPQENVGLSGSVEASNLDLRTLSPLLGKDKKGFLGGQLNCHLQAFSKDKVTRLEGPFSIDELQLGSVHLKKLEGRGEFGNKSIAISQMQVVERTGKLLLSEIQLQRKQEAIWEGDFKLKANDMPLGFLPVSGRGAVSLSADLKKEKWKMRGSLDYLAFNKQNFENLSLLAELNKDVFTLKANNPQGKLSLEAELSQPEGFVLRQGEIRDSGATIFSLKGSQNKDGELDLRGEASGIPAADLAKILGWNQAWTGRVSGNLKIQGLAKDPRMLLLVRVSDGSINHLAFDLFSGEIGVADQSITLSQYQKPCVLLKKGKYQVELDGTIPIAKNNEENTKEMNLRLRMPAGDLSVLKFLDWVEDASGPTRANLHITGTIAYPSISGSLKVEQGEIMPKTLWAPLKNIRAVFDLDQNCVQIYDLRAQVGEENQVLQVENGPLWNNDAELKHCACLLKQFAPDQLNLKISSGRAGIRLENHPELALFEGTLVPQILVQGTLENPAVSGSALLRDCKVTYPPKIPAEAKGEDADDKQPSLFRRTDWNLAIQVGTDVRYQNDYADVVIETPGEGLILRGEGGQIGAYGTIKIPRGDIHYFDMSFKVDDARLKDPKPSSIELRGLDTPYFDIHAYQILHNDPGVRERVIRLAAVGGLADLKPDFSAEPPLSQAQIYSLVATGVDLSSGANLSQVFAIAMNKALGLGGGFLKDRLFGKGDNDFLDVDFSVKPGGGSGPNPSTAILPGGIYNPSSGTVYDGSFNPLKGMEVSAGKGIGDKVYVDGRIRLDEEGPNKQIGPSQLELGLQYRLNENLDARASKAFGDNDAYKVGIEGSKSFGSYVPRRPTPSPVANSVTFSAN